MIFVKDKYIENLPNFFDGAFIIGFIEFIIAIIAYVIVDINKNIEINIKLKFLILIVVGVILFIILNIKYIRKVKECFNSQNKTIKNKDEEIAEANANRMTLIEDNDKKDAKIRQLNNLLMELSLMYDDLIREINNGLITITDGEKEYLKGLIISAYQKKEHIARMKGNDYNG